MSYLSPLTLLLQELGAGGMYCPGTFPSDAGQGYFPQLCSSFLPTGSPKGKCKPRSELTCESGQRLMPLCALAVNAGEEMKQVRQNWSSVGGLLTAGKIKSKLKE